MWMERRTLNCSRWGFQCLCVSLSSSFFVPMTPLYRHVNNSTQSLGDPVLSGWPHSTHHRPQGWHRSRLWQVGHIDFSSKRSCSLRDIVGWFFERHHLHFSHIVRVLVMEDGCIVESGHPNILLQDSETRWDTWVGKQVLQISFSDSVDLQPTDDILPAAEWYFASTFTKCDPSWSPQCCDMTDWKGEYETQNSPPYNDLWYLTELIFFELSMAIQ